MSEWSRDPRLTLTVSPEKGRCLIATAPIPAGTLLEVAPILWVPPSQTPAIDASALGGHVFAWGIAPDGSDAPGAVAVALGLVSIANHADAPNADFEQDFDNRALRLIALADIAAGEEITVDYGIPLWFEQKPAIRT